MAKKRISVYDNMTASDLARITRERGMEKPNVLTLREWADFLEADDAKRLPHIDVGEVISDEEAANMPPAEFETVDDEDLPMIEALRPKGRKR